MGILTNPNSVDTNKIIDLLNKHHLKLSIFAYLTGLVWLIILANAEYNLGTYFSENALLPGLVIENFRDGQKAEGYLSSLLEMEKNSAQGRLQPEDFASYFHKFGFDEIEYQNFTIRDPISKKWSTAEKGKNVFAVLRAKRASGTESIIFNAPYFPKNPLAKKNLPAISIMLALADYFKNQVYWAKDIVFIIAEGHYGSLAWVKGHQEIEDSNPNVLYDNVRFKAGNIQAAVNLILENTRICSLETKFNGINGQLPNLDLLNLLNKFIVTASEKKPNWEKDIFKLIAYMEKQSTGRPSGSHGFFLKYGIESVTLSGYSTKKCSHQFNLNDIGRILEATFRSLNNLLEKLHQSFFFYLKTTPNRFISIGLYFGPIALILFPILLKGTKIWLVEENLEISYALFKLIAIHSVSIGCRWLLSNHDKFLSPSEMEISSEHFGIMCFSIISLLFILTRFLLFNTFEEETKAVHCLSLMEIVAVLFSLALYNPSLVIIFATFLSPLVMIFNPPKESKFWRFYLILAVIAGLVSYFYPYIQQPLIKSFNDSEIYGNFLFDYSSVIVIPLIIEFISSL